MVTELWVLTIDYHVVACFVDPHAIEDYFQEIGYEVEWNGDPHESEMVSLSVQDQVYYVHRTEVFN